MSDGNGIRALAPLEGQLVQRQPGVLAPPDLPLLYGSPVEQETHFWDYWRVLVRRRWTVLTCFLVTVIAATVWTFTTRPTYTGTATIRIEKEQPRILKFEQVMPEADSQQDYYQTQYKVLQSRTLANRVIGMLALDQHPEFADAEGEQGWLAQAETWLREWLVRWIPMPPPPAPEGTEDVALSSPLTDAYLKKLSIEPVRNSRLVRIAFDSHYPDVAARVANAATDAFMAQQLDQKIEATRYATQFLAKQLDEARDKLGQAEGALNAFLKDNDILFVGADRNGQPQDLITQQLVLLSEALLKARGDRIARESVIAQPGDQDIGSLPAVLQSPLIAQLKQDLTNLDGEYKKLGQTFKPEYPRMQQLAQKIGESRRQLEAEISRAVAALQVDYRAAVRNEREIEGALAQQRTLARGLGERMAEYNLLRRDVDTSRDLYSSLLGRLRETQISSALLTSNIYVVDRAEMPPYPSRPRKVLNLLLATVVGLFGGVGLAFFREYLDTNIRDVKEVESVLRVPILGMVPSREALGSRRERRRLELEEGREQPLALVTHTDMTSVLAEAFRNLRTSLLYSAPDHPPKTIMVTSIQPEDGKTSLSTNLAIALAQLGSGEVLLIDADMRRPNLHELLEVAQAPGLSTYLTGQAQVDEVIKPTRVPNLSLIPSGRVPLNPADLLTSTRLRETVEALGQRFAYVVFDTCPLFGVSDSMILASKVEGVILVLRQGRSSRDAAQRAIRNLTSVRAKVLGVILNDVDVAGTYYGYHGYGYNAYAAGAAESRDRVS